MRNSSIDRIMRIEGKDFEKNNKVVDMMRRMQLNKEQIFIQRKKSEQAEAERQQQLKKVNSTRFLRNDDMLVPLPNKTITQSRSKGAFEAIKQPMRTTDSFGKIIKVKGATHFPSIFEQPKFSFG